MFALKLDGSFLDISHLSDTQKFFLSNFFLYIFIIFYIYFYYLLLIGMFSVDNGIRFLVNDVNEYVRAFEKQDSDMITLDS